MTTVNVGDVSQANWGHGNDLGNAYWAASLDQARHTIGQAQMPHS